MCASLAFVGRLCFSVEMSDANKPVLYNAGSSYYSMIARLSLVEAGIEFEDRKIDIHRRAEQQTPEYVKINPNMTVPALVLPDRVLSDSSDILAYAFSGRPVSNHELTKEWVRKQYAIEVEQLTFGWLLSWNVLARWTFPRTLRKVEAKLQQMAEQYPDLRQQYLKRAEVFAERQKTFDVDASLALFESWRKQIIENLSELDALLADGRDFIAGADYGPADVVWTVLLARLHWVRLSHEIAQRPNLAQYTKQLIARPSFDQADIWLSFNPLRLLKQVALFVFVTQRILE